MGRLLVAAGDHPCAAPRCVKTVPADKLMCVGHWRRLPRDIQGKVWRTWRNVRRDRGAYEEARDEAVAWHEAHSGGDDKQGELL